MIKVNSLIAVYGTLKKDHRNHSFLDNSKFISIDHTGTGYALFVDGLPFLVERTDGLGCEIEIYEVDQQTLDSLDQLEGHPFFYQRKFLKRFDNKDVYVYLLERNKEHFQQLNIKKAINSF